ncbi:MAG TPA: maltose ABC transporter substrate-binding protein [Thermotogota bacterium]|nr:maltose ABC transporter substrate-binding protein [Thermotogota bacterium]HPJ88740.1 maltose ABC transporter substrate-binding protein [Thermotogota bacterium]HPR97546.1 maltose ABC transporter substrate-binding protein [Thermotogota bacterium]
MKKIVLAVLICCLLTGGLFAANPLKVWTVYKPDMAAYQALQKILDNFVDETSIAVDLVSIPDQTDMDSKIQMAAPAGMGPDVIATMPHDIIGKWANQGLLYALDDHSEILKPFFDSTIMAVTYNGKTYGMPLSVESVGLVYNKALVEKAPETFDEVIDIIKQYEGTDTYGLVFPAAEPYHMYGILKGFGGYIFGWKDNQYDVYDIGMDNAGAVEAINYLKSFFDNGYFPEAMRDTSSQHAFSTGTFEQGKAALQINGPWVIANLETLGIDYGVSVIPMLPNGEYPQPFLGVQFVGISNYSSNKEDALKLAEYITSKTNMAQFALETQLTPTRSDVLETAAVKSNEQISAWAKQAELGNPMPNIPEMSSVWSVWSDALQITYFGKEDTETALKQLSDAITEKIEIMRK